MTVFYRKYRPQKISEIDSEDIRKSILSVLSSKRIPHAFLLTGPRGLGKTSTARIIAKSVNCLGKGKDGEPCGKCDMCLSITNGTNLDVLEMDAASNRGIDEIRDLRDKVKLAPSAAKYKVYIIDEVHMLTNEAFNALLKTLEEPPSHAIFILCTTEPQKLPETIISRCIRFVFKFPSINELVNSLKRTKKGEKIDVDDGVLELIAEAARGSFRDAQKIFDQLSLESIPITKKMVIKMTLSGEVQDKGFLKSLSEKDTKMVLDWIADKVNKGMNVKLFIEGILDVLHKELLRRFITVKGMEAGNSDLGKLSISDIKKLLDLFYKAHQELKGSIIPELPLEIAVIEWGEDRQVQSAHVNSNEFTVQAKFSAKSGFASGGKVQSLDEDLEKKSDSDKKEEAVVAEKADEQEDVNKEEIKKEEKSGVILAEEEIVALWPKVLSTVKPYNYSVEALLRSSRPMGCDGKCLNIEVFYKFHKERLEEPKAFELLSKVIGEIFGQPFKIKYFLGEKKKIERSVEQKNDEMVKAAEEIFR